MTPYYLVGQGGGTRAISLGVIRNRVEKHQLGQEVVEPQQLLTKSNMAAWHESCLGTQKSPLNRVNTFV